jgi:hypothetical protein
LVLAVQQTRFSLDCHVEPPSFVATISLRRSTI